MGVTIDSREFVAALKFVTEETNRTLPVAINKGALTTIIGAKGVKGAMQLTPKASKAAIDAIPSKTMAQFVVNQLKKKGMTITRIAIAEGMKKEYARRKRASGYTAFAGWSNAAKRYGGRGVRGVTSSTKKLAKHGRASVATVNRLVAEFINTAPAAELIGVEALEQSLKNAAKDQMVWAERQIQKAMNKVRAR